VRTQLGVGFGSPCWKMASRRVVFYPKSVTSVTSVDNAAASFLSGHLAGLEIKPARLEDSQHINSTSIIHYSSNGSSSCACVGETFSLGRRVFVS
jgi:hypothetical protein